MNENKQKNVEQYYQYSTPYLLKYWSDKESMSIHYGFWYPETKSRSEAFLNQHRSVAELLQPSADDYILDIGCGVGGVSTWLAQHTSARYVGITLADCIADGNPAMESYPRQCATLDGETFTEYIGNELEKNNLIIIESPRPNATISSPIDITGQARGEWFFEGEFTIYLHDVENNIIGQANAIAEQDLMTEEFVHFDATITFPETSYGPGKLYLNKSNPSDNPELDDSLIVPIDF